MWGQDLEIVHYTEWLSFWKQPRPEGKKTDVFFVANIKSGLTIASIHWNTGWRRYCFYPESETVWDSNCLKDITFFLDKLMVDYKDDSRRSSSQAT